MSVGHMWNPHVLLPPSGMPLEFQKKESYQKSLSLRVCQILAYHVCDYVGTELGLQRYDQEFW